MSPSKSFCRFTFVRQELKMTVENLIIQKQGTIIDVRTYEEFVGGHIENSINIPLPELTVDLQKIKELKMPLILCCASGGRSGMAQSILAKEGIECYNAGSWLNINYIHAQNSPIK